MINETCSDWREYLAVCPDYRTAWAQCERGDWMLWAALKAGVDRRQLAGTLAECAGTVRHLMRDTRSVDVLDALRRYADGEMGLAELKRYASAAAAAVVTISSPYDSAAHAAYAAVAVVTIYFTPDAYAYTSDAAPSEHLKKCSNIVRKCITFEDLNIQ